uniref:Uncharacterized protein n=1 Tax=Arion vulgaris TaxID=1028688 RepID=A0A0B6ZYB2_9EUPU
MIKFVDKNKRKETTTINVEKYILRPQFGPLETYTKAHIRFFAKTTSERVKTLYK